MLRDAVPVAFLATTDAERARAFYGDVLGLELLEDNAVALVFELAGTALRVAKVSELTPQPFTVLGWVVADVERAVDDLASQGVTLERFESLEQDERGVWRAPSDALVAWFCDPDGNILSITQLPS